MEPVQKNTLFVPASLDDYGLTANEFRILGRISRRGECTESAANIARLCMIGERTVRLTIRFLAKARLIEEQEQPGLPTIRKITHQSKWAHPDDLETIRKSITENWKKTPEKEDTPATIAAPTDPCNGCTPAIADADPCNDGREPLQPLQPTPATIAAEGNPIKVIPKGNPIREEKTLVEDEPPPLPVSGNSSLPAHIPNPETFAKEVFAYWVLVMKKPKAQFTPKRKKKVLARLKNYSVSQLKQAVDGCKASQFHVDGNFIDLELICRDGEHVEMFIDKSPKRFSRPAMTPNSSSVPTVKVDYGFPGGIKPWRSSQANQEL